MTTTCRTTDKMMAIRRVLRSLVSHLLAMPIFFFFDALFNAMFTAAIVKKGLIVLIMCRYQASSNITFSGK